MLNDRQALLATLDQKLARLSRFPCSVADYLDLSASRETVHDRMWKRKRKKR